MLNLLQNCLLNLSRHILCNQIAFISVFEYVAVSLRFEIHNNKKYYYCSDVSDLQKNPFLVNFRYLVYGEVKGKTAFLISIHTIVNILTTFIYTGLCEMDLNTFNCNETFETELHIRFQKVRVSFSFSFFKMFGQQATIIVLYF